VKGPIKQLIPQGVCLKCKGCCRFSQEDSVWLPTLLNQEIAEFEKLGLAPGLISANKKIRVASFPKEKTFICSLFNPEGNICKIYEQRPFECRLYPFILKRRGAGTCLAADENCPFVAAHKEDAAFKEYASYLINFLQDPGLKDLLKENPQMVGDYPQALELSLI